MISLHNTYPDFRNPRIPGGINRVVTTGEPSPREVEVGLEGYLQARQELFRRARTIIKNRVAHQLMTLFHGATAVIYGIKFVYESNTNSFRASIENGCTFIEHVQGVAESMYVLKELEEEWIHVLLNIQNMPPIVHISGEPRGGNWT